MVMEATPSPQSVGREFVRQYYTLLNKAPAHLHRFYNNYSSFVHGGLDAPNRETLPVIGQKQIHNRIQQLNFRDCHAKISQVDSQATLGNGVVVQVTGELSNGGAPMRRFTQTFVLAAQSPKKYYVHNDIFRYQDIVFSDEESEGACAEDEGGYFPNAPATAAPYPTVAVAGPPAPQPHLNGHPDPATEQIVAGIQNASLSLAGPPSPTEQQAPAPIEPIASPEPEPEPEVEFEPEPQPSPAPPAMTTTVASPPEPKTYANLLKSGSNLSAANVVYNPPQPQRPPRTSSTRNEMSPQKLTEKTVPAGMSPRDLAENSRKYSDSQQLFLGNLPPNATEDELRAVFGRFGAIAELRIHGKGGGSRHNNYGFITYEEPQAAQNCLNSSSLFFPPDATDGTGTKLNVEEKRPRTGTRPDRVDRIERGERGERGGRGRRPPFGSSRPPNTFNRR